MKAIHLTAFGNPTEVLEQVEIPEPPAPASHEVRVEVGFSPVNPNDLMVAEGIYIIRPTLPSVIGNEGVGRVIQRGSDVQNVKVGDRVLLPLYSFAWRERLTLPANGLFALSLEADLQQLSMLRINPPTAGLLLSEYVDLKPGDWVVQNAANSGVGRSVIALAKARGLKTVNLVRRKELIGELIAAGGDVVLVDSPELPQQIKEATGEARLSLGMDGVSGAATGLLAKVLSPDSTIVVYSGISGSPISLSSLDVIFKRVTVCGFSLADYQGSLPLERALKDSAELINSGCLHVPVAAVYPLSAIKDAVAHVQRGGKVLLKINSSI